MVFNFAPTENPDAAVKRVAREQIAEAMAAIITPDQDPHIAVHEVRKRCKKIRALLRLVRKPLGDTFSIENTWYRDASRSLAMLRDAQSMVEAVRRLDKLADHDVSPIAERLVTHRDSTAQLAESIHTLLHEFLELMGAGKERVVTWSIVGNPTEAFVPGFIKTYKRGRSKMKLAIKKGSDHLYHEWRKSVKYHRHHMDLMLPLDEDFFKPRLQLAEDLGEILGQDHDLVLISHWLDSEGKKLRKNPETKQLKKLIKTEQKRLRKEAIKIGGKLFQEKPKKLKQTLILNILTPGNTRATENTGSTTERLKSKPLSKSDS